MEWFYLSLFFLLIIHYVDGGYKWPWLLWQIEWIMILNFVRGWFYLEENLICQTGGWTAATLTLGFYWKTTYVVLRESLLSIGILWTDDSDLWINIEELGMTTLKAYVSNKASYSSYQNQLVYGSCLVPYFAFLFYHWPILS